MRHLTLIIAVLLITVAFVAPAIADPMPAKESGPAGSETTPVTIEPTSPLGISIKTIRDESRLEVMNLQAQLNSIAQGSLTAQDIQRQITQVKLDTEIAILETILADAVVMNDTQRIDNVEAALDRLINPDQYRTTPVASNRPAPSR